MDDIAEHICQIERISNENFFLNYVNEHLFVSAVVMKGLMLWGSKCHQNNPPVVCDNYVKYEEAEIDRLVAILKTNNCGGEGGGGPCGIQ